MGTLVRMLIPLTIVFTSACASLSGWTPTIDPYNTSDEVQGRYTMDLAQCKELALQSSGGSAKETVIGAAIGAAAGGIGGGATQGF